MEPRTNTVDLGWNPAGDLNFLLVQPLYAVVQSGDEVGRIEGDSRDNQKQVVDSVIELVLNPEERVSANFQPLHAAILPELAAPQECVRGLLEAVAEAQTDPGMLVVSGIERLSREEYEQFVQDYATDQEWQNEELRRMAARASPSASWVNAMLIAWRDRHGEPGVVFQRKISPSAQERESLCAGETVHILVIDQASFAFTICSDMLNVDAPGADGGCSVAQGIVEHFQGDEPPRTLDAIIHIQHNQKPDHELMAAGFYRLLVDSPQAVGAAVSGASVVRVNAAAICEERDEYGCTGILVGGHRRYAKDPPECCCRRGESIVRYDFRPRRASAFLVKARLPSRTPGPFGAAGIQPVTGGLWLGIRPSDGRVDFTSDAAAVPEAYRFAAWRGFPCELRSSTGTDLLEPSQQSPVQEQLYQRLRNSYEELRRVCWGINGECLQMLGQEAFVFWPDDLKPQPDTWDSTHVDRLRHLVAGLTMVHAWFPLQAASISGTTGRRAAVRLEKNGPSIHSRDGCDLLSSDIPARVVEDASSDAKDGDIYLICGVRGQLEVQAIPLGGLTGPSASTYPISEDLDDLDITRATLLLIPIQAIEDCVLEDGADDLCAIGEGLRHVLAQVPGLARGGDE